MLKVYIIFLGWDYFLTKIIQITSFNFINVKARRLNKRYRFYTQIKVCLYINWYDVKKLVLTDLNFNINIIRYTQAITIFSIKIRLQKISD